MNGPFEEQPDLLPAVEHMLVSLDGDAEGIQGVADRLVQGVGAGLDQDKAALTKIKGKLTRSVGQRSLKPDKAAVDDIAGSLRTATALSLVRDEDALAPIQRRLVPHFPGLDVEPPITGPPHPRPPPIVCPPGTHAVTDIHGAVRCEPDHIPGPPPPPPGTLPPTVPPPSPPPPGPPPVPPPPCPPPVPCPAPGGVACGPLPDGMPGVRVYVVPWLDPGDAQPTADSECGKKMILETDPGATLAATVVAALATADPATALIGRPPQADQSLYVIPGINETF